MRERIVNKIKNEYTIQRLNKCSRHFGKDKKVYREGF